MNKIRVNITVSKDVHEKAKFFSAKEGKSLSENIEDLLGQYYRERMESVVSEPIMAYSTLTPMQSSILNICRQLPPENQSEVEHFAEFLLSKNSNHKKKISLYGVFKDQIFMSDDFDEPLEMFTDYMP